MRYVRARPFDVEEDPATKDLTLRYEDLQSGALHRERFDLVVLSTGLVPASRNAKLAKVLRIDLDEHGFFAERDSLLAPLQTAVAGVFLCGGATGPIDISESVVQAAAASMKAVLGPRREGER